MKILAFLDRLHLGTHHSTLEPKKFCESEYISLNFCLSKETNELLICPKTLLAFGALNGHSLFHFRSFNSNTTGSYQQVFSFKVTKSYFFRYKITSHKLMDKS